MQQAARSGRPRSEMAQRTLRWPWLALYLLYRLERRTGWQWLLPLCPFQASVVGGVRDGICSSHLWFANTGLLGERLEWRNGQRPLLPFLQFRVNMVAEYMMALTLHVSGCPAKSFDQDHWRHHRDNSGKPKSPIYVVAIRSWAPPASVERGSSRTSAARLASAAMDAIRALCCRRSSTILPSQAKIGRWFARSINDQDFIRTLTKLRFYWTSSQCVCSGRWWDAGRHRRLAGIRGRCSVGQVWPRGEEKLRRQLRFNRCYQISTTLQWYI